MNNTLYIRCYICCEFVGLDYEPYKIQDTYIKIMSSWFYIGFIDVQYLHEDDLDRSKHLMFF